MSLYSLLTKKEESSVKTQPKSLYEGVYGMWMKPFQPNTAYSGIKKPGDVPYNPGTPVKPTLKEMFLETVETTKKAITDFPKTVFGEIKRGFTDMKERLEVAEPISLAPEDVRERFGEPMAKWVREEAPKEIVMPAVKGYLGETAFEIAVEPGLPEKFKEEPKGKILPKISSIGGRMTAFSQVSNIFGQQMIKSEFGRMMVENFPKISRAVQTTSAGLTVDQVQAPIKSTIEERQKLFISGVPGWVGFAVAGGIAPEKVGIWLPTIFTSQFASAKLSGRTTEEAFGDALTTTAIFSLFKIAELPKDPKKMLDEQAAKELEQGKKDLGVKSDATPKEIKDAFYKLSLKTHPDKPGGSEAAFKEVNATYQKINKSYRILRKSGDELTRDILTEAKEFYEYLRSPQGKDTALKLLSEVPAGMSIKDISEGKEPKEIVPAKAEIEPAQLEVARSFATKFISGEINAYRFKENIKKSFPQLEGAPLEAVVDKLSIFKEQDVSDEQKVANIMESIKNSLPEIIPAKEVTFEVKISKESEPLMEEAKKYKSAEEFYNKVVEVNEKLEKLPDRRTFELKIGSLSKDEKVIARMANFEKIGIEKIDVKKTITDFYNKAQEVKPLEPKKLIKEAIVKPKKIPIKTQVREFTGQVKDIELRKLDTKLKYQAQAARKAKAVTKKDIIQKMRDLKEEKRFLSSIREGILKGFEKEKNIIRKQIGFQRYTKELGSNILSRLKQKAGVREWKNATIEQLNSVLADIKLLEKGDVFISRSQVESLKEYGVELWTTKQEAAKIFGDIEVWKRGGPKIVEFLKVIDQKIEHTAGKDAEKVKNILTRPRAKHVTEMVKEDISLRNDMRKTLDDLGVNTNKDRALIMEFGEKRMTLEELKKKAPDKWEEIVKADTWFREQYDKLLEETNKELSRFYSVNKLIPRRKDYYTHSWEVGNLWDKMKSSGDINPVLEGVSEFTRPNRKFNPFALRRWKELGFVEDAGKAFEASLPFMLHNKYITQDIVRHRAAADILAYGTIKTKNLNQFIHSLQDAANSLAGKTNPFDRALMNSVLGRKGLTIIKWFPTQLAKNRIIGNVGSAIMQISGIPGSVLRNNALRTAYGFLQQAFSSTLKEDPLTKSDFLIRRYGEKGLHPGETVFPTATQKGEKFFSIPFVAIEKPVTKAIWRASYNNAYSQGYRDKKLMEQADEITASIVGSRSLGEKALAFESGILSFPLQFQLEVNTFAQLVDEDILKKVFKDPKRAFRAALEVSITLFLLNTFFERFLGRTPLPDPIRATMDVSKMDTFWEKMGRIVGEYLSSVAGGQFVAAIVPDNFRKKYFGRSEVGIYPGGIPIATAIQGTWHSPERIIYDFVLPYGGGQVKKFIEGVSAIEKQGSYNKSGKLQFPINQEDWLQIVLFGKYSTPEAREYFDKQRKPLSEKQTVEYFVRTQKGEDPQLVYEDVAEERLRNEYKREIVKLITHEIKTNPKQGFAVLQLWIKNGVIDKQMEQDILEKLTK